jgi:hypothetical protein
MDSNQHLLILDGHCSHITLQVVCKAAKAGLDIITLPFHTSHYLQPLDIAVFRPFKYAFRNLRDAWTLRYSQRPTQKEDLCQWVCLALQKALSPENIKKGFQKTGIWPLNPHVVDDKMGPSLAFVETFEDVDQSSGTEDDVDLELDDPLIAEVVGDKVPESQPDRVQYYVRPMERAADVGEGEHKPRSIPCDLTAEEGGHVLATESDCRI